MKVWKKPQIFRLGIESTYDEECVWIDTGETLGLGNEDYTDPNVKPSQHPDWVWCTTHNRWHPKNHSNNGNTNPGIPENS